MKKETSSFKAKFWQPKINEDITLYKGSYNNFGFDKHFHDDYTVTVVKDGVMDAFLEGSRQKIGDLNIIMMNPGVVHDNFTEKSSSYHQYTFYLPPTYINKFAKEFYNSAELFFKENTFLDLKLAKNLMNLVKLEEKKEFSKLEFESHLISNLNELLTKNITSLETKKLSSHESMVCRAKEFINDNYQDDLSLDDISKALDISKYHFLRLFKKETFLSPHSFLMIRRIEKAKEALTKGLSLAEVAYSCGFNDQSHLNKRFKASLGLTPGEYQKFFK